MQAVRTSAATIRLSPSYKLLYSLLGCCSLRRRHARPLICVNGRQGPARRSWGSTTLPSVVAMGKRLSRPFALT